MTWTQVTEVLCKYWVEQVCVVVVLLLTGLYNKRLKRNIADQKSIKLAMLALLRDRFYQSYKQIILQGYYPIQDREVMEDIYQQYHALGGNGVITRLKEDLDELPTMLENRG